MSRENIEVVRRVVEAFNEAGVGSETAWSLFADAAVFEEPPEQPGPGVAHGRKSIRRMFSRFEEAWEKHQSRPEEIRAVDHERVLLLSVEHFRGRDGLEIDQPCGTIYTLRGGKIVRMQSFWDRANALGAAGLRE